jgi:hypothetical protein
MTRGHHSRGRRAGRDLLFLLSQHSHVVGSAERLLVANADSIQDQNPRTDWVPRLHFSKADFSCSIRGSASLIKTEK